VVPAPVLAQAWRGGPQHRLSRLLKGCVVESMDAPIAREAGRTCAAAGSSDVVDATVAATAIRLRAHVVTSDRKDMEALAQAVGQRITLRVV
jgi:predicted nucleic acid-binding protein